MKKLYLIPGLATDERLFHRLEIPGVEMVVLNWAKFKKGDDMKSYAKRLAAQIETSKPFSLLGVSFGGMCAVEIAKVLKPEKLILISSAKGSDELPFFIKKFRFFPLHKALPQWMIIKLSEAVKHFFGRHKNDDKKLLLQMLQECPDKYLNGAINCIVTWKSHSRECTGLNILHIHGTADRVIPVRNIKEAVRVKGGNHFMVLNQSEKVGAILKKNL